MIKVVMLLVFSLWIVNAQNLEISADKFIASDSQKRVDFIGNAHIIQGETSIHASRIVLYFNEDNSTKRYEAKEKVKFRIKRKQMAYRGVCAYMEYMPKQNKYILEGNVYIKDQNTQREMHADSVKIDTKTGAFVIKGNKKRKARLIFEMK